MYNELLKMQKYKQISVGNHSILSPQMSFGLDNCLIKF